MGSHLFVSRTYSIRSPSGLRWSSCCHSLGTLALSIVIGAISRGWQGAITLNLIASLPAALLALVVFHASSNGGIGTLYLLAPLAALGWFGWLLRFVRAEFAG